MGDPFKDSVADLAKNVGTLVSKLDNDQRWREKHDDWKDRVNERLATIEAALKSMDAQPPRSNSGGETRAMRAKVKTEWIRQWGAVVIALTALAGTVISVYATVKVAQIVNESKERK